MVPMKAKSISKQRRFIALWLRSLSGSPEPLPTRADASPWCLASFVSRGGRAQEFVGLGCGGWQAPSVVWLMLFSGLWLFDKTKTGLTSRRLLHICDGQEL
jgi:hypothetical protein